MKHVKFNTDAFYNGELLAKRNEILKLEDDFANRWIRRGHSEVSGEVIEAPTLDEEIILTPAIPVKEVIEAPTLDEGIFLETVISVKKGNQKKLEAIKKKLEASK